MTAEENAWEVWTHDAKVMTALDEFLNVQQLPLDNFLTLIFPYSDQTPIWAILILYGKFVTRYNELRIEETESDAFNQTVADLANEPLVAQLVGSMMGKALDRGMNIE